MFETTNMFQDMIFYSSTRRRRNRLTTFESQLIVTAAGNLYRLPTIKTTAFTRQQIGCIGHGKLCAWKNLGPRRQAPHILLVQGLCAGKDHVKAKVTSNTKESNLVTVAKVVRVRRGAHVAIVVEKHLVCDRVANNKTIGCDSPKVIFAK
jgi:hypothetical protein